MCSVLNTQVHLHFLQCVPGCLLLLSECLGSCKQLCDLCLQGRLRLRQLSAFLQPPVCLRRCMCRRCNAETCPETTSSFGRCFIMHVHAPCVLVTISADTM
jgi:hypothetical protein